MGKQKTDVPILRSVECRSFKGQYGQLLFDVNRFNVISSSSEDMAIIGSAGSGQSVNFIAKQVAAKGFPIKSVKKRIGILADNGFLASKGSRRAKLEFPDPDTMITFMVNLAHSCNLTCDYCYVHEGKFDYGSVEQESMTIEIAEKLVKSAINKFPEFETYCFHFYGGEPLINYKAMKRIVLLSSELLQDSGKKAQFDITTNGTLLTKDVANFMDDYRFNVYLSVDGNGEEHDRLRKYRNGRGSYRRIMDNFAYLQSKKNVHVIGSSVIRSGLPLKKAFQILEEMGVHQIKAEHARLPAEDPNSLKRVDRQKYLKDIGWLARHYVKYMEKGRRPLDYRLSSKIIQLVMKKRRNSFCYAGTRMFGVSTTGDFFPCSLHVGREPFRLGSITEGMDKKVIKRFLNKFNVESRAECLTCWARHLCGGGCSAMLDRFDKEDCDVLQAEAEAAISVYHYFLQHDVTAFISIVSPKLARWANGEDTFDANQTQPI